MSSPQAVRIQREELTSSAHLTGSQHWTEAVALHCKWMRHSEAKPHRAQEAWQVCPSCDLHPVSHPLFSEMRRGSHHTQQTYPAPNTLLFKTRMVSLCSSTLTSASPGLLLPKWCCWCQFIKNVNSKGTGTEYTADASREAVTPAYREILGKQIACEATLPCNYELQIRTARSRKTGKWEQHTALSTLQHQYQGTAAAGPARSSPKAVLSLISEGLTASSDIPNHASLLLHPESHGQSFAAPEE